MLVALRAPIRFRPTRRAACADFPFLAKRFTPRSVFMAIETSPLALRAAGYVERVYAIDVSGQLLHDVLVPCNVRIVLCDGVRIPVPEASVHVAWSGAFMDHLHPDDAREHLQSVRRALAPGGEYICASGDPARLREAGFSRVRCYVGPVPVPWAVAPPKLARLCARR